MPDNENPWRRPSPPPRPLLPLVAFALALVVAALAAWRLSEMFPGVLATDMARADVIQRIVIIALVASGFLMFRRMAAFEVFRNFVIWSGVALALGAAFLYQNELKDFAARLTSEVLPGEALVTGEKEVSFSRSTDGHFYIYGEANGMRVRFLVDTGASDTVLSPADASRIGIDVKGLDYTRRYSTANGTGFGARSRVALFTVGPIEIADMPVSVNQAEMETSLLGMSFLTRLESFEIRGNRLYLRRR